MYKPVATISGGVGAVGAVAVLPETGANIVVTIATALVLGLAIWAATFFFLQRRAAKSAQ